VPFDGKVVFANTGKERPETLAFVHKVAAWWDLSIAWVEAAPKGYRVTSWADASKAGEPFADLIARKKYAPNALARFCTEELKVKPMLAFAKDYFGGRRFAEAIGLRADEPWRVAKMMGRNSETGRQCYAPLAKAGVRKEDVLAFWREQEFDLDLPPGGAGNCDLCFLKSRRTLQRLIAEDPSRADWWSAQERAIGGRFVTEYSYAQLKAEAKAQPDLFNEEEHDAECGLLCAAEIDP
jgi:3'-phosphoadenosine 5'-phosphosulfate sulfotransferase (PAPS reductase)/FAD synthetase